MRYLSHGKESIKKMFKEIGVNSFKELFKAIPNSNRIKTEINYGKPKSEAELLTYFSELENKNKFSDYRVFIGGGSYYHLIPETVNYLSSRAEFVTPYTPYQAEVSQGTLQTIFEYQTLIANLTGMKFSNASLYDGATAAAEGILMAWRVTRKNKFLISRSVHPEYIQTINTYVKNLGIKIELLDWDKKGQVSKEDFNRKFSEDIGGILVQSPNFFGVIEDYGWIKEKINGKKILVITNITEALSLGTLKPPSEFNADIVVGEAQSFGMYPSYGGPGLGFISTANKKFLWEMPGRIVGETSDEENNRGYVLTLATREQHIRRERATSNICTNQSWCVTRTAIFLSLYGKQGLKKLANLNIQKANYAREKLKKAGIKIKFDSPIFNEFVISVSDVDKTYKSLLDKKIIAGIPLKYFYPDDKNSILLTFTEVNKRDEIDELVKKLEESNG